MGEHKNGSYSGHRLRLVEASVTPSDARAVLTMYLANIFPSEPADRLEFVAEHQIDYLKRHGYRIVPVVDGDE